MITPRPSRPPLPAPLLAISNRRRMAVEPWTAGLVRGGVRWLLLREKDLEDRPLVDLAGRCRELAGGGALVMISGRADLCRAAGLAGVHLPAHGPPTARLRRILGEAALIGRSTHTRSEVELAAAEGADYVVFGPVFPPLSKPGGDVAQGLEALAAAAGASIPVYALGGVTLDRLEAVAATGAAGAAGITLFTDGARIGTLARRADELFRRRSSSNPPAEGTSR